jgi:ribonuclease E
MRSIESLSLSILRVAEEHAMKENTGQVLVQAPTEIANYLLNEKRRALAEIEQRHESPIVIVADEQLETPHYEVTRIRENELNEESARPSYQRGTPRKLATIALTKANLNVPVAAAVTNVRPAQPAPIREPREEMPVAAAALVPAAPPPSIGLFGRILGFLRGEPAAQAVASTARPRDEHGRSDRTDRNAQRRDGRDGRGGRQQQGRDNARRDEPRRSQAQGQQQPQQQKPAAAQDKPRNEQPRQQQQKQGQPRQQQQPKPQDENRSAGQQPRQPRPPREEPVAKPAVQPAVAAEVTLNPALEAAVALPSVTSLDVDTVVSSTPEVAAGEGATESDGSARRRRGRRGGRRRRRGGENASATDAAQDQDEMLAGDMPTAAHRSQPEFDFEDEEPGAVAPAVIGHSAPTHVQVAEPMPVRPAAIAVQAVAPAAPAHPQIAEPVHASPIDASPADATSFDANLADANPVESAVAAASIEPAATEPQPVDIATTPSASIEPTASAAADFESTAFEPAVPMFAEIEPQATDNAASASAVEATVADAVAMPSSVPTPSPGLFDMLPTAPVIDIDPAEEAAKAVAHVSEAADGADNETARNA